MGKGLIIVLVGIALFIGSFFMPFFSPIAMLMMLVGIALIMIVPAKKIKDWWNRPG